MARQFVCTDSNFDQLYYERDSLLANLQLAERNDPRWSRYYAIDNAIKTYVGSNRMGHGQHDPWDFSA